MRVTYNHGCQMNVEENLSDLKGPHRPKQVSFSNYLTKNAGIKRT